jgi:hypothetical protein
VLDRFDDILIACTPAQVAFQAMSYFLLGWVWIVLEKIHDRDDHAGRAESTLKTVFLPEGILHRMQIAIGGQAFNGGDTTSIGLHRQDCAGFDGDTIHQYIARTALTGVTTNVCACQPNYIAQEMREQ